jgi:hypothetical protein
MIHLLKVTALNLPRLTRGAGVMLALVIGLVHVWVATHAAMPSYVSGLLLAAGAAAFLAGLGLLTGFRSAGWRLAVVVSGGCFVAYLVSRTVGMPGFAAAIGAWHTPLGTLALTLEALLAALYLSLRLGWNVDAPGERDWETYFSYPRQPGVE